MLYSRSEAPQADKCNEFHAVQAAWRVLGHEASRREYDRELQTERATLLRASVTISLDDCDIESGISGEVVVAACRCGGRFEAALEAVEGAGVRGIIVACVSCSLKACIIDVDDDIGATDASAAAETGAE